LIGGNIETMQLLFKLAPDGIEEVIGLQFSPGNNRLELVNSGGWPGYVGHGDRPVKRYNRRAVHCHPVII